MGPFDLFSKSKMLEEIEREKRRFHDVRFSDNECDYAIHGGRQKNTGGHDHRTNTGDDRTPAQKAGDRQRRKRD